MHLPIYPDLGDCAVIRNTIRKRPSNRVRSHCFFVCFLSMKKELILSSFLLISLIIGNHVISSNYVYHPIENHYLQDEGNDNQFGSKLSRCEYHALRLGSEIADVINAPHADKDTSERIFQDFVVENLGFAPWVSDGIGGNTLTGKSAREIHKKGGWIDTTIDESTYSILNHKWIYMFGDSTTRQVWASYAAPFRENNFERNAKEWTRHYCNKQSNRKKHPKDGHFDEEGWRGPCGVNEVNCHVSGYGENGLLSFDWKHFPFEDYDEYMWNEKGPWRSGFPGEGIRRPDLLTVQMGLHTCWHATNEGLYSRHSNETNVTMIENHIQDIWKLMKSIRVAIDSRVNNDPAMNKTTVIILTSGLTGFGMSTVKTDACVQRINRVTKRAANAYGFAVLERGEIERRLMYNSLYFDEDPVFPNEMHLVQPAQNLVATTLLHLYSCLEHFSLSASEFDSKTPDKYPIAKQAMYRNWRFSPLHTPQH